MRLYISADMEGTAGVCSWMQVNPDNAYEYPVYRRYMNREVAAAIAGAREAQPCDVTINDSHWNMRNLLWDELPADVRTITGHKPLSMAEGAPDAYDAAFFTGYHSAVGVANSTLAHTYSGEVFYNVYVNGKACTEALLNAALLGVYETPTVLITGDRAIVETTLKDLPWATGVIVKESIGYFAANSLTPQAACDAIRDGAREALKNVPAAKLFTFEPPIELVIETAGVEHADFIELLPRFERTGGRTVRFVANDYETAFRAFLVAMRLGGAANLPA